MTNIPRDHTGRPIRPTDLADLNDPTPPLSPKAKPTDHQKAAMEGAPPPQPPKPPRQPGSLGSYLAWMIILVSFVYLFASRNHLLDSLLPAPAQSDTSQVEQTFPEPDPVIELQSRLTIGFEHIGKSAGVQDLSGDPDQTLDQLKRLSEGDPVANVRIAMLAAELQGPDAANAVLDEVERDLTFFDEPLSYADQLSEDVATLRANYANPDFNSLSDTEQTAFVERHGWIGELALTYGDDDSSQPRSDMLESSATAAGVMMGAGLTIIVACVIGFILFILAIVFLATGTLKMAYGRPISSTGPYAEAFALFFVLFILLIDGPELLARVRPSLTLPLFTGFALMWLLPLTALWPLLRGIPKAQWKLASGFNAGKGFFREIIAGFLAYLAGLPILVVGFIASIVLLLLVAPFVNDLVGIPNDPPSHPIIEQVQTPGILTVVMIYAMACVWAPLTEEALFRGALYHNTRRAFHPIISALFTGFVFAAIHPQGWAFIPVLMAMGTVLAIMREWRNSLIAPMTAHAIHNAFLVTMLVNLM